MLRPRQILSFAVLALVLYAVLVAPWPGVREGYASAYRGTMNTLFGAFGSTGRVRFEPREGADKNVDTRLVIRSIATPLQGKVDHNTYITGYLPTVQVIVLVLATPIVWSRRWRALLVGLGLVHVFIFLRVLLTLVRWFSEDQPWALFHPGPWVRAILMGTFEFVAVAPESSFIVPALIWILVCFRRSDLLSAVGGAQGTTDARKA